VIRCWLACELFDVIVVMQRTVLRSYLPREGPCQLRAHKPRGRQPGSVRAPSPKIEHMRRCGGRLSMAQACHHGGAPTAQVHLKAASQDGACMRPHSKV
jgi:hypothetical protein